jgi:cell division septation protein DedD
MSITITWTGENIGECIRAVSGVSGSMSTVSTEQLVEELRRRLRPQGLAVNIDPAEEAVATDALDPKANGGAGTVTAAADKPKRGRPAKPKPAEPETTEQAETPSVEPETTVTRERVIEALSAYSAAHGGQVAARDKMKEVTGKTRLVDIPPEDYAKLIARLTG